MNYSFPVAKGVFVFVTALFVVSMIVAATAEAAQAAVLVDANGTTTTTTGTTTAKTPFGADEGNDCDDDNTIHNQQHTSCRRNNIIDTDNFILGNRTENAGEQPNSNSNSSSNNIYESPDVEWCRRRPTWRKVIQDDDDDANDNNINTNTSDNENDSLRNRCRKALGYHPDLEQVTDYKDPLLSSSFDISVDYDFEHHSFDEDLLEEHEDPETYHQLPILERPLVRKLSACMDQEIQQLRNSSNSNTANNNNNNNTTKNASAADSSTTTGTMKKARVSELYHRDQDHMAVMGIVEHALTENEAEAVLALAICARLHLPLLFQARDFSYNDNDLQEEGGNDVTFLAGFLQLLAPGVAASIQQAAGLVWKEAAWEDGDTNDFVPVDVGDDNDNDDEETTARTGTSEYSTKIRPDPVVDCGIRTTEHLSYDKWKGLGHHVDADSDYTVLVMLSDPDDYEGGEFYLCPDDYCRRKITVKPTRLSAIVFLSNYLHGVEDIQTPGRVTFANELWRYGDVPAMDMRPGPDDHVWGSDDDDDDYDDDYDENDDENENENENDDEDDDEKDAVERTIRSSERKTAVKTTVFCYFYEVIRKAVAFQIYPACAAAVYNERIVA